MRRPWRWTLVGIAAIGTTAVGVSMAVRDRNAGAHWMRAAHEHIAAREYRASENGQGLQAPNRAHNLRTYFDKMGIRVHDRTASGSPELLRLSLAAIGRGTSLAAIAPGSEVAPQDDRVEIHRPGLVEWYVNSPEGLEQGFTLAERPAGDGPLVVELAVAGARPGLLGDAIVFETSGRKLRYGELVVADANQRSVAAHFALASADRLRIVVDDAGATYPVVIDPLLTGIADTQLESNLSGTQLGWSVDSAGDVNGDGYADLIVGADGYDAGQNNEGAAFIFHGSGSGIANANPATAATQLESNQGEGFQPGEVFSRSQFGSSVAAAGDVNGDGYDDVIVGAEGYNGDLVDEGAAFVFLGSASGIADGNPATAATRLESNTSGPLGAPPRFGNDAAGAGDVNGDGYGDVVVGADDYSAGQHREGAVFVFLGSASGIAHGNPATAATQLESNVSDADLGQSVAPAGDVNGDGYADVIVGDPGFGNGQTGEGGAFVFHGSATGIASGSSATAATQLESNQAVAVLGWSVAGGGDVNGDGYSDVIVGARGYDAPSNSEGAAFVFLGGASGVADGDPTTAHAQLESDQSDAMLGERVAMAGDVNGDGYGDVIVGARLYDAGHANEGAAFVFHGSASGIADGNPSTAAAQLESNQAEAWLHTVAGAGDVNGDGYADVIAGAYLYDNGQSDEGAAFVYLGGGKGIASAILPFPQYSGPQAFAALGASLANAGDINGDGYSDFAIGMPGLDNGQVDEGGVWVFLGSATEAIYSALLESDQASATFGSSVAGAGDVNGDGYADLIVGASQYDNGQMNEGAAFVFHGSASGIDGGTTAAAAAQLESDQASVDAAGPLFGQAASAGDVNGDGYADVIVGAPRYDNGQSDEGAAFVFAGSASGIVGGNPATALWRVESDQSNGRLGSGVSSAGDVNGDGYADIAIGGGSSPTLVFHGSATGIATSPSATLISAISVDEAGDINADGYGDLVVGFGGAPGFVAVHYGSAAGIAGGPSDGISGQPTGFLFGASVAGAGDVNGDGYADIIIGDPGYDADPGPGVIELGAAFVFLGSAAGIVGEDEATAAAKLRVGERGTGFGASVASAGDINADGFADVIIGAPRYEGPFGDSDEGAVFLIRGGGRGRPLLVQQRRGDGSGVPVQPWGGAQSSTSFAAELRGSHPSGTGRVRGEFEACPPGVAFGNGSCTTSLTPTWVVVDGATSAPSIAHSVTGLTPNTLYRWRTRVLHAPATGPIPANPAHGPWRRLGAQSIEGDIRLPEPGFALSLAAALLLLTALARRRGCA